MNTTREDTSNGTHGCSQQPFSRELLKSCNKREKEKQHGKLFLKVTTYQPLGTTWFVEHGEGSISVQEQQKMTQMKN